MNRTPIYAPKIFSGDPLAPTMAVFASKAEYDGIEAALYGHQPFQPEAAEAIRKVPSSRKILHFWQRKVFLSGLAAADPEALAALDWEIGQALDLGISKAVIHSSCQNDSDASLGRDPIAFAEICLPVLQGGAARGVRFHVENIFEDEPFMRAFFTRLAELGAAPAAGFCLDTGHARAYSSNPLPQWSALIRDLRAFGFSIHYHMHLNDGSGDQHLSLSEASVSGLLEERSHWAPQGFLAWAAEELAAGDSETVFCQEHPSAVAPEALGFIRFLQEDGKLP